MLHRPRTVVFDVVETLMSLEPLRSRFADVGLAPTLLDRWLDRLLRDGMALTLADGYQPFPAVAAAALRTLARGTLDDGAVGHVLAGFGELPAHPDVEPTMRMLAQAGISMVCLSNGTAEATTNFLGRNNLSGYVDTVISVAEVTSWKPRRQIYDHAVRIIARPASEVALIAVHAFDCHGAKSAGWVTGWASRLEGHYAEVFTPADVVGDDLIEVVTRLLALPA
ncbi:HAD family hydrolase [Mycobacterium sp.]|uniref:HAD family hydrolase n=1 Tax=Mycobacterium sp. TaxID=1785 RepID=UPI0031E1A429